MTKRSKMIKCEGFRWRGVELKDYGSDRTVFKEVTRQTIIGEGRGEEAIGFLTRYFEIQPGGYSSLEFHQHPHSVVVLRGAGRVVIEGATHEIGPFDAVYVSPGAVHQFQATGRQPLGFLCIVDRVRDRPTPVEGLQAVADDGPAPDAP